MDILAPLFANSGLSGAIIAGLLAIIFILLRDHRTMHSETLDMQKETNKVLMELAGIVKEFKGSNRN